MKDDLKPDKVLETFLAVEDILLKWDSDALDASTRPPTPEIGYLPVRIIYLLLRGGTIEDMTKCLSDPCMKGTDQLGNLDHRQCAEQLLYWWKTNREHLVVLGGPTTQ